MDKPTFADVMASKKNGRRIVTTRVCFSPDINQRYAELEEQLEEEYAKEQDAKQRSVTGEVVVNTRKRLVGGVVKSQEIAEQMAALIAENRESFYELKFQQATRTAWLALRSQHPPRDGVEEDGGIFNNTTFPVAAVTLCLVDPEPSGDVIAFLEENIGNGEWDRLALQVWLLNEGARDDPKSDLALSILNGNADG
jgi:hypothetical protein